jgi:hypothetical protein
VGISRDARKAFLDYFAGTAAVENGNEVLKPGEITQKGIGMYHRAEGEYAAGLLAWDNANRLAEKC